MVLVPHECSGRITPLTWTERTRSPKKRGILTTAVSSKHPSRETHLKTSDRILNRNAPGQASSLSTTAEAQAYRLPFGQRAGRSTPCLPTTSYIACESDHQAIDGCIWLLQTNSGCSHVIRYGWGELKSRGPEVLEGMLPRSLDDFTK